MSIQYLINCRSIVSPQLDEEEAKKKEDALSLERSQDVTTGLVLVDDEDASITPGWDEDQDDIVTDEAKIKIRTEMILTRVWQEYDARMYTKQTTKMEFFDANTEKAKVLAIKELEEEKEKKLKELVSSQLKPFLFSHSSINTNGIKSG